MYLVAYFLNHFEDDNVSNYYKLWTFLSCISITLLRIGSCYHGES